MSALRNIALVGASGHVGSFITNELIAQGKHNITALTRPDSTSKLPSSVSVREIDYSSRASLVDALKGQDALVITMSAMAPKEQEVALIEAAAEAGVSWVLPNSWGSDTDHPAINRNPVNAAKAVHRQRVEELGKSSWIAVVNNQWYEWSLGGGFYGIQIQSRKARFFDEGEAKTVTTTWPQVGRAVARLLALPTSGASPCLENYKNKHLYISSFYLSQKEMLQAVQRNTGTTDADWEMEKTAVKPFVDEAYERFNQGERRAVGDIIYGSNFLPDGGNDYVHTKETANKALGLPEEDLDEATKRAIEESAKPWPKW